MAFLAWKWLPALFDVAKQGFQRLSAIRGNRSTSSSLSGGSNQSEKLKKGIGRSGILRLAALVLVMMVIYMPTYATYGALRTAFAYRFIWTLGSVDGRSPSIEPAVSILLAQVVIVVAIAGLLAAATRAR